MDNLRLKIAQFNNYIIENYLAGKSDVDTINEPYYFFYKSFIKLSENLGHFGQIIGAVDYVEKEDMSQYKDALAESSILIFLIESSENEDELVKKIRGIYTNLLNYTLNNIDIYGKQFANEQTEIDLEIRELQEDNRDYFDEAGNLKYAVYQPTFDQAINYLIDNSPIVTVRNNFKQLKLTNNYLTNIIANTANSTVDYSDDNLFLGHLLNSLTIILIALSYVEPFFEKPNTVVAVFETSVNEILASQTAILNAL